MSLFPWSTSLAVGIILGMTASEVGGLLGVYERLTTGAWPTTSYAGRAKDTGHDAGELLEVTQELYDGGFITGTMFGYTTTKQEPPWEMKYRLNATDGGSLTLSVDELYDLLQWALEAKKCKPLCITTGPARPWPWPMPMPQMPSILGPLWFSSDGGFIEDNRITPTQYIPVGK